MLNLITENIITIVFSTLTGLVTGLVSFVFTKRQYQGQVKSTDLDNVSKTNEIYEKMSRDFAEKYNELKAENKEIREQLAIERAQCEELRKNFNALQIQFNLLFNENKKT
ncbi:MAG TPA: hypothetical protein PLP27_10955, partial [Crocinitomicaceae bacterium]|nr:hypothetical protein [Crocinitomicaceae bacterium]